MVDHPPESADHGTWYVALVRSGREQFAKEHLLDSGFDEAFYPRRRSIRTIRGKSFEVLLPHFNGYVFCRTDLFTPFLWHATVRATEENHPQRGLVRAFSGGWPAAPVTDSSIEDVRSCCDVEGIVIPTLDPGPSLLPPGTLVRVLDGAWTGHLFTVIVDVGAGLNIRAVQNIGFVLYTPRERVEVVSAEPGSTKNSNNQTRSRPRKRMFRAYREASVT